MRPDRSNYEIWLVDYLDGNLDSEREKELLMFLDENPDLREELSDMEIYKIPVPAEKFTDKKSLKKTAEDITDLQFEMMCVSLMEKELNPEQESELEQIIASSEEKRRTADLIGRSKLLPPDTKYRYKTRLKRLTVQQKVLRISFASISAAAAVLLLFTIIRKPLPAFPENQVSVIQNDTAIIEKNTITTRSKSENIRQQIIAVNASPRFTGNDEQLTQQITNSQNQNNIALPVDSSFSRSPSESIGIGKVDFRKSVNVTPVITEYDLVAINLIAVEPSVYDERPGLGVSVTKFFREKILRNETTEKGSIKAYEIADAGINGLNRLFGWEMKLEKKKDEKGEVNSVYFNSRLLKFNAPVKKSEPAE